MPERWSPWKDAAYDLDASLDIDVGTASSEVRLVAEIDGVSVHVLGTSTPYLEGSDSTRIRAKAPGCAGMRLRITKGAQSSLARLFGERDVDIGVDAFDTRFNVLTNDLGFAKSWLGVDVRREIVRAPGYDYTLRRSEALAERDGLEDDAAQLVAAVRAIARLARQATRIEREWSRCAAELGGIIDDDPTDRDQGDLPGYTVRHSGAEVRVARYLGRAGRSRRKQLFTRISCKRTTHTPDTYAIFERQHGRHIRPRVSGASESMDDDDRLLDGYDIDCESPERLEERMSKPTREHIISLAPALIRADREQVVVFLWGLVRNDERMQSVVTLVQRLAVEIASGSVGPYR